MEPLRHLAFVPWRLTILDQTLLPHEERYRDLFDHHEVAEAIAELRVRGAPAIGIAAAYGFVLGVRALLDDGASLDTAVGLVSDELVRARPTAVNLRWAVERMRKACTRDGHVLDQSGIDEFSSRLLSEAIAIHDEDLAASRAMAEHAFPLLENVFTILTHCNTGGLATGGLGTALGAIRFRKEQGGGVRVFATETRPLLQGARLTAYELERYGIDYQLIVDSAAASIMRDEGVEAVVVGADRVAANGDTANKIGTYALAVAARQLGIPFYVVCPTSTIDFRIAGGDEIPIEYRRGEEIALIGGVRIAPDESRCLNPAFDVTPANLVTAIITERGVARPPFEESIARWRGQGS